MMTERATSSRRRLLRAACGLAVLALTLGALGGAQLSSAPAASAIDADLPTWNDVQKAKGNQAEAAKKITEIEGLIRQVQAEVEMTRQAAEIAAAKLFEAEAQLRQAEERVEVLEQQAAASEAEAEEAAEQAAALVSQMYRSGGVDRNLSLFLEADESTADALLDRLAQMQKATERNTAVSEKAEQAMNTAKSLGEQASSARDERDRLRAEAQANQEAAAAAAAAATEQLAKQESQKETLEAQLAALKDTTASTVAGYEERLRQEAEERRRQEEEARQNGGSGPISSSGWTRPLACCYRVTTEFWGYSGHTGIDLAIGAGTPILAASGGRVVASGWFGSNDYGWGVFIEHAGGVTTRYAHMVRAPSVSLGQYVSVGQVIGYVGSTGFSYGNHLHFETRVNGVAQNPRTFMSSRGIGF